MSLRVERPAPPLEPDEVELVLAQLIGPIVRRMVAEEIEKQGGALRWAWLPPEQAAEILGVSADAIRHRVKRGQMPGRTIGRRIYVDMKEFDRQLRDDVVP